MEVYTLDWLDYREKLGIGFNDAEKLNFFVQNFFSFLRDLNENGMCIFNDNEYFKFCIMTATPKNRCFDNEDILYELRNHTNNLNDFLSYCVAIINSKENEETSNISKENLIQITEKFLNKSHIKFDVVCDENNNYFIFPKGAKELDDALVSEPLEWLKNYPKAHKTFCNALKQYSEGIYIRDVADNLRKALEEFLQEFLGNEKNLETNKNEICKYLGDQSVDSGISGLYQPLINSYKNINDRIAKHHDKIDEKLLEFLLYQTGVLIRMTITVKNAEE